MKFAEALLVTLTLVCPLRAAQGPGEEVRKNAGRITEVTIVRIAANQQVYRLSGAEVERFKEALRHSRVSNSLASQGPEWDAVMVVRPIGKHQAVLHPFGSVLRVNRENPYSSSPANAAGRVNPPTIQDLLLESEDADWLEKLLTKHLGETTNQEYRRAPAGRR